MQHTSSRRRFLGALAGAATFSFAGCTESDRSTPTPTRPPDWTPTPTATPAPLAYRGLGRGFSVEVAEDRWGRDPEPTDATRERLPDVQAAAGPGIEVRIVGRYFDYDRYGIYGDIRRRDAVDVVEDAGFEAMDSSRDYVDSDDRWAALAGRLETLEELDVDLPDVWVPPEDAENELVYGPGVSEEKRGRLNEQLQRMGLVVLSLGDPSEGRLWPVRPGSASLDGTTLSLKLTGEDVSWLLSEYDVPSNPVQNPLHVYIDGEQAGTRVLSDNDLAPGPRLADPWTDVFFHDEFTAAGAYAAVQNPAGSFLTLVEQ